MEKKILRYFDAEMRAVDDESMNVEGYALKFDRETVIGSPKWGFREKIAKTALDGADLNNVVFDFNHSFDSVMARTTNKSLQLIVDSVGLKITAAIVDTTIGRDVYKLIKDGLINQMSFWARVKKSVWTFVEDENDEMDLREITEFEKFYDVSAVTFPAYEDTSITARNEEMTVGLSEEMAERRRQLYERQIKRLNKILSR